MKWERRALKARIAPFTIPAVRGLTRPNSPGLKARYRNSARGATTELTGLKSGKRTAWRLALKPGPIPAYSSSTIRKPTSPAFRPTRKPGAKRASSNRTHPAIKNLKSCSGSRAHHIALPVMSALPGASTASHPICKSSGGTVRSVSLRTWLTNAVVIMALTMATHSRHPSSAPQLRCISMGLRKPGLRMTPSRRAIPELGSSLLAKAARASAPTPILDSPGSQPGASEGPTQIQPALAGKLRSRDRSEHQRTRITSQTPAAVLSSCADRRPGTRCRIGAPVGLFKRWTLTPSSAFSRRTDTISLCSGTPSCPDSAICPSPPLIPRISR